MLFETNTTWRSTSAVQCMQFRLILNCLQLALIMLENVRADFSASKAGQAGRIAVHSLQIDNQLLTTPQPVVLARAFRVRLKSSILTLRGLLDNC